MHEDNTPDDISDDPRDESSFTSEPGVPSQRVQAAFPDEFLPDSHIIDSPVPGMSAFMSDTPEAVMTRGAQLILMGHFLQSDETLQELQDEGTALGLPFLNQLSDIGGSSSRSMSGDSSGGPMSGDSSGGPMSGDSSGGPMSGDSSGGSMSGESSAWSMSALHRAAGKYLEWDSVMTGNQIPATLRLWDKMHGEDGAPAALALLFSQMTSPHLAVRVASASALSGLATMDPSIRMVLMDGMRSPDVTVRTVAGMALSKAESDGPATRTPRVPDHDVEGVPRQRQASVTVHGTFSGLPDGRKDKPWHRPGDPLHQHVLDRVGLGLYADKYFRWSGAYSQPQRDLATRDLRLWAQTNGVDCFDVVYAHSHGGNIAMSAAAEGMRIRVLVLMHVPILNRDPREWRQIASNVGRVIQLRTRCDWVVLADRSGQRIPDELPHTVPSTGPLGTWFSHSFYTKAPTWVHRDLASLVSYEHGLSLTIMPR
jgi:hypothetical protein